MAAHDLALTEDLLYESIVLQQLARLHDPHYGSLGSIMIVSDVSDVIQLKWIPADTSSCPPPQRDELLLSPEEFPSVQSQQYGTWSSCCCTCTKCRHKNCSSRTQLNLLEVEGDDRLWCQTVRIDQ